MSSQPAAPEEGSAAYKAAGVDTAEGQRFVRMISRSVESTYGKSVIRNPGGFAGLIDASFLKKYDQPVLVSSTDGVGTKLQLARLFNRHDTVGVDLVAMCSNDILVTGALPLIFLDYIAVGRVQAENLAVLIESISDGCRQCGASLMGGETAEHPGTMKDDEYDLAGFMVGVCEKSKLLDGKNIRAGDAVIGLPSSGIHSNGLSLVRKIFMPDGGLPESAADRDFLMNDILLKPTYIYEKPVRQLLDSQLTVNGMVHITGGGFYENIPRIVPDHLTTKIDRSALNIDEPFLTIQRRGNLADRDMFSVFNMGIGLMIFVPDISKKDVLSLLESQWKDFAPASRSQPRIIGTITDGQNQRVIIE